MANVNIRLDDATKAQFDAFCSEVGISVSAAFNLFAKRVVKEQRIPFDITTEIPNAKTTAAMEAAETGRDVYGPFDTVADLMEALNA